MRRKHLRGFRGFPTPDDMPDLTYWRNYIVSRVTEASLGRIPVHTLSMSVFFAGNGRLITLAYQLTEVTDEDIEDMKEIVDQIKKSTGSDVENSPLIIYSAYEVTEKIPLWGPMDPPTDWANARGIFGRNHNIVPMEDPNYTWIAGPQL